MDYGKPSDFALLMIAIYSYIHFVKTMEEYPATYHLDKLRQEEHKKILSHFTYNEIQLEKANNVLHNLQEYDYNADKVFDVLIEIRDKA